MLFVRAAHVPGVRAAASLLSGHRWEMGSGEDGTAPPRSSCGPPTLLQTHPRRPRPTAQSRNAAWSCPGCGFEGVIAVIAHPVKLLHTPCTYCTPHEVIAHPMHLLHTPSTYCTSHGTSHLCYKWLQLGHGSEPCQDAGHSKLSPISVYNSASDLVLGGSWGNSGFPPGSKICFGDPEITQNHVNTELNVLLYI